MHILEVAPVLRVPSPFPRLSPSCQRQITITSVCHGLQVSRFSQRMPTISMAWILAAPLPPSWLRTVSMLWREEKTEGARRSAAVSMNGGYSPRQLPQAHTGAGLGRPLSPSSCPAQCKPPSAAHTLIPTLLTPLADPLCAPLLPPCYRLPRGKRGGRRGSAGVRGNTQAAAPTGVVRGDQL